MKKLILSLALVFTALVVRAADTKIVFIAGPPSHGPGEHEYRAGLLLFQSCLDKLPNISTVVYTNGWPTVENSFDGASTIVAFMDGGGGDPLLQGDHLKVLGPLMDSGVGFVCLHYAVEPTIENGEKEFLQWLGGAYEINWSVNPTWTANFKNLPDHPITRGVKPFELYDEWYFNMRFPENTTGLTPILTAIPGPDTMSRKDGPHEGNPAVREMVANHQLQTVAWAFQRPNGGRGFGWTGGHYHRNWANDNVRKLVLNGILWTAKVEVPANGVESTLAPGQIDQNFDAKK